MGQTAGDGPRDEVDDLVAAWHAERPDLDVAPLQVLSRVSRLARHLDRARRAGSGVYVSPYAEAKQGISGCNAGCGMV